MTSKRARKDPLPRFGGRPLPFLISSTLLVIMVLAGVGGWYWGSGEGGFDEVRRLGSIKCLGCLGLDPVVPGFSGFWTLYPEGHTNEGQEVPHPASVEQYLGGEISLLILFFWTQGCVPCAEQWEEMVDLDIAQGTEEDGSEGRRYEGVKILSIDAADDPVGYYRTYRPEGTENGVPMTTFLFKGPGGAISWYSHYGKMEGRDVESMETRILYHEISIAHNP